MDLSLQEAIANILGQNVDVSADIKDIIKDEEIQKELQDRISSLDISALPTHISATKEDDTLNIAEAIVLVTGRPVLFVQNDSFIAPESDIWQERLNKSKSLIESAIKAVGRVELRNHPTFDWVGTAWLVASDILVTNRHVAREFAAKQNNQFVFLSNPVRQTIRANIDFKVEYEIDSDAPQFKVKDILYIEDDVKLNDGSASPDIAFLRVSSGDSLATPISLFSEPIEQNRDVAVIGYPARDGDRNNSQVMDRIFAGVYDVKRLQPGKITGVKDNFITHDCSTLGGNSGSVVLDLETGKALGLHFAGTYRKTNYAVPAWVIKDRLDRIR
ncbi:MAG: trypsin-like peptidase domain-containing protein [Nostoc sp. TH1S01]|nr:trypsin-like peptidase domain-containing protein [Nostoc sp. TH1S01]